MYGRYLINRIIFIGLLYSIWHLNILDAGERITPRNNTNKFSSIREDENRAYRNDKMIPNVLAKRRHLQSDLNKSSLLSSINWNTTLIGRWAEGPCEAVAIRDNFAFIGNGSYLEIIDIQNPVSPQRIGRCLTPSIVYGITVASSYVYVADFEAGLRIIDITNPASPTERGFYDTGGYARGVAVAGNYAYIANDENGLRIIDITNPASPTERGFYDTGGYARGVAVAGNYAYVADGYAGLRIIDITNPASLIERGFYVTGGYACGVAVAGNYAYVADGYAGLRIIDITNPASPTERGFYDTGGYARGVTVAGNYAYIADDENGLRIIDLTNPASPTERGFYTTGGWAFGVVVAGNYAYIADDENGLRIIDITNPASPTERGFYDTGGYAHGVVVAGNYAYVADGYAGLRIIDITNPASPTERGFYDTDGWAYGVAVAGNYAYVADGYAGLRIIDITNPASPTERGFYDTDGWAYGVAVAGNYAYVADGYAGLRIIDITNPASPIERGFYDTGDYARGVAVSGNYAYVADYRNGLRIIDITNPASPTERGFYDTGGYARGVAVAGNYAYIADDENGLRIIDITNPTSPTERGFYDTGGYAYGVAVAGNYAYVADYRNGLRIIDITNPASPTEEGFYDTGGYASGVAVAGNYAYVTDRECGLYMIRNDLLEPEQFTDQTEITLPGVCYSSVAWGDYDDDGDLDILLTGHTGSSAISKVYRNNGNNTFSEQSGISLTGVYYSSVAWGDYDNDGDLDILMTGYTGSSAISKVYRNNGNNTFSEQSGISLTGVYYSSVAWGDYDNDGDLDILLTGFSGTTAISKVYRNNGNNTFSEQSGISLTGVYYSSVAWGDYDNDGDLDILMTGQTGSSAISKVYCNNGNNTFSEQSGISLTGVYYSSVAWGDYDNDGDLDILLTGYPGTTVISKVYRNNGNNTFSEQSGISLTGVSNSSVAWGDYDNDGDLDILLTGYTGTIAISKVYRNNGNNTFSEQNEISFQNLYRGSVAWGDYDNDGDLDILMTGYTEKSAVSKIYRNNSQKSNAKPSVPNGLKVVRSGKDATFSWEQCSDAETPQNGLTYNLYIGTTPGSVNIKAPMSDIETGYHRIVQMGNVGHRRSWTIKDLPSGSYWWSVQAIDNCYSGSAFAEAQIIQPMLTLIVPNGGEEMYSGTTQSIRWSSAGVENIKIEYTVNGSDWIVIASAVSAADSSFLWQVPNTPSTLCRIRISDVNIPDISDQSDFTFSIKTGQFTDQTEITLPGVCYSSVAWGDYDNDGDLDILMTGHTGSSAISKVYRNNGNNTFSEQSGISLTGIYSSSVAWGDYDNDGDLDILLTGFSGTTAISKVYRNNGNNTFSEQSGISLTGVYYSSVAWGDYDNDGDLDILLTGFSGTTAISKVYRNNGNNTFSEQSGISLTGIYSSSVAWGDYDNDGDLDILLTGFSGTTAISKVYRNNGNNTFSEQSGISLTGIYSSSVAWGDYDNDGDLDILLTGFSGTTAISKVYRNNGNNTFSEQNEISLTGVSNTSVAWGDYDNDGDLDILLTGYTGASAISKVYRNNGNNTFCEQNEISFQKLYRSSVAWGDYDNDGDLDILVTGYTGSSAISKIYRNNNQKSNAKPSVPNGLKIVSSGKNATFSWEQCSDAETPQNGLTYNLYIGTTPGSVNIKAPMSDIETGYRRIVQMGNVGHRRSWTIKDLPSGSYWWSIQAIDNCYSGSAFTGAQIIQPGLKLIAPNGGEEMYPGTTQSIRWSSVGVENIRIEYTVNGNDWILIASAVSATDSSFLWQVPNTPSTLCRIRISDVNIPDISDQSDFTFSIKTGQFTDQTEITLPGVCYSSVAWGDYDNDGDLDILLTGFSGTTAISKVYRNNGNNTFSEQSGISLTGVYCSSVAWGDYDNDGDLDILMTGHTGSSKISKVYRNNGNDTFSEQSGISLTGVYCSSVAWGDYDNDGDLDILITGHTGASAISKVYRNNGNNTFSEQSGISLTGVYYSSVAWGDYDNDGDLDILLTGFSGTTAISKVYRNNGNNTFSEQSGISLTGVSNSSVAWGDYDNDGDLDILLTGHTGSSAISKVYRNNGDNTFSEQDGISLTGVYYGSVAWGDYDNDGDLDILLTGHTGSSVISKVYRNNDNNTFSEQDSISLTGVYYGSIAWGDYDNDGDLDFLLTGHTGQSVVSKIYLNISPKSNTKPSAPTGLKVVRSSKEATFSWEQCSDAETPQNGLTYNLYIGTTPGSVNIKAPMSDIETGYHRIVQMGNVGHRRSWTIKDLPSGSYWWSIQAIDNCYSGSAFAEAQIIQLGLKLIAPNGGEEMYPGTTQSIRWSSAGVENIRIEYTVNGSDWILIAWAVSAADSCYAWNLPRCPSSTCKIKVTDVGDASISDESDNFFSILFPIKLISPIGGEIWIGGKNQQIQWITYGIQRIKIEYTLVGNAWQIITTVASSDSSISWKVPDTPSSLCKIRICDDQDSTLFLESNYFSIVVRSIDLLAPNGGEYFESATSQQIKWHSEFVDKVKIDFSINDGLTWHNILPEIPADSVLYYWIVPEVFSNRCRIRVSDSEDSAYYDISDRTFSIHHPLLPEIWSQKWEGRFFALGRVYSAQFSPEGTRVLCGGHEGTLILWDAITGANVWIGFDHSAPVWDVKYTRDGARFGSVSSDKSIIVWDNNGTFLWRGQHQSKISCLDFSKNGRYVATGSDDGIIKVWDVENGSSIFSNNYGAKINSVSIDPNGIHVAAGGAAADVKVWHIATDSLIIDDNHSAEVYQIAFSIDGNYIASVSRDNTICLRSIYSDSVCWVGKHSKPVRCLAFNHEGNFIATGSEDLSIKIWDVMTGGQVAQCNDDGIVYTLAFSPDGFRLLTGNGNGKVRVWDILTGNLLWTGSHSKKVNEVTFSSEGQRMLSCSDDESVKVWELMEAGIIDPLRNEIPLSFTLFQSYPNPFNSVMIIEYLVPEETIVKIVVYDLNGAVVQELVNERKCPGHYSVSWNARNAGSGIYFYRMTTNRFDQVRKCALVK